MRVLQIYKDYFPPVLGGIERHINLLSKGLVNNGFDVNVLVSNDCLKLERSIIDGVKVTKAPECGRVVSAPLNPTLPGLIKELSTDSDILHFHLPNPTAVCALLLSRIDKPIVATYHSDIIRQARIKKVYWPIQKRFLNNIDAIIATSPNYINSSKVLRRYKQKCCVIPLGVDTQQYENYPEQQIIKKMKDCNGRTVLFVGKLRYYKGLNVLIEAMQHVNGNLVIVGDGPFRKKYEKEIKVKKVANKIKLVGAIQEHKLQEYFNSCKVFVLPSTLRSEAFGIVLTEAMVCGKPVISTELGTGTSFVNLHKKTGLVVPPNDSKKLSQAINYLLDNKKINEQYGKNAQKRIIKEFNLEKMIATTIDIYKKVYSNYYAKRLHHLKTKSILVNNNI